MKIIQKYSDNSISVEYRYYKGVVAAECSPSYRTIRIDDSSKFYVWTPYVQFFWMNSTSLSTAYPSCMVTCSVDSLEQNMQKYPRQILRKLFGLYNWRKVLVDEFCVDHADRAVAIQELYSMPLPNSSNMCVERRSEIDHYHRYYFKDVKEVVDFYWQSKFQHSMLDRFGAYAQTPIGLMPKYWLGCESCLNQLQKWQALSKGPIDEVKKAISTLKVAVQINEKTQDEIQSQGLDYLAQR